MITGRTNYRGPFLRYHISARDKLCFHCPVKGGCNDSSPQCLRKLHKTAQVYIVLLKGAKTPRQIAAEIGQSQKTTIRWLKIATRTRACGMGRREWRKEMEGEGSMKIGTKGELYWKPEDISLEVAVKTALPEFMARHYGLPAVILTREQQAISYIGNIPVTRDDDVTPSHFWLVIGG